MENLLTVKELSEKLGLSKSTIYDYVHRGIIPHIKMKKAVRFSPLKIKQWLKNFYVKGRNNRRFNFDDPIDE